MRQDIACKSDPNRWSDPDLNDIEAVMICRACPERRQCAVDALRVPNEGLFAGVIIPSSHPSNVSAKMRKTQRKNALEKLAHIAGLDLAEVCQS